jgi:hypothetical protein
MMNKLFRSTINLNNISKILKNKNFTSLSSQSSFIKPQKFNFAMTMGVNKKGKVVYKNTEKEDKKKKEIVKSIGEIYTDENSFQKINERIPPDSEALSQFNKLPLIIFLPALLHSSFLLYDFGMYSTFKLYNYEAALKNVSYGLLFLNGLKYGYFMTKTSDILPPEGEKELRKCFLMSVGTMSLTIILTSFAVSKPIFIALNIGMALTAFSSSRSQRYPYFKKPFKLTTLLLYIVFITLFYISFIKYQELFKQLEEKEKLEEALKFFETSTDKEFLSKMDEYQNIIDDLDLKIEKEKA